MGIDRRRFTTAGGLTAAAVMATSGSTRTGRIMSHRTGHIADDNLARLGSAMQALVTGYGSTPPAQTALQAWNLSRHIGAMTRWGKNLHAGRDWQALHSRILVLEGNALIDAGDTASGIRALTHAEAVAELIGDWPTIAHAHAVRAMAARALERWQTALDLAREGQRYAGSSPVAVMLALGEASARARLGDTVGTVSTVGRAQELMDRLPTDAHGTPAYSLDSYHPTLFATMAASVLVLARQTYAAAPFLSEARERVGDSATSGGLTPLVHIVAADAALSRTRVDVEEAEQHVTNAVAASAGRPAAWVGAEVAHLAAQAARHGADWSDLVELTSAWDGSRQ